MIWIEAFEGHVTKKSRRYFETVIPAWSAELEGKESPPRPKCQSHRIRIEPVEPKKGLSRLADGFQG